MIFLQVAVFKTEYINDAMNMVDTDEVFTSGGSVLFKNVIYVLDICSSNFKDNLLLNGSESMWPTGYSVLLMNFMLAYQLHTVNRNRSLSMIL